MTPLETFQHLRAIEGKWHGNGKAFFPTTATFDYEEDLAFEIDATRNLISYYQKTWLIDSGQNRIRPSHFEFGFIRIKDDGSVECNCAQSGGRVEILTGTFSDGQLTTLSKKIENDVRTLRSKRIIKFDTSRLSYEMSMATNEVSQLTTHLVADLTKVS